MVNLVKVQVTKYSYRSIQSLTETFSPLMEIAFRIVLSIDLAITLRQPFVLDCISFETFQEEE